MTIMGNQKSKQLRKARTTVENRANSQNDEWHEGPEWWVKSAIIKLSRVDMKQILIKTSDQKRNRNSLTNADEEILNGSFEILWCDM